MATLDLGGIPESMFLDETAPLRLSFQLKMHNYSDISPIDATRKRSLLAVSQEQSFQSKGSENNLPSSNANLIAAYYRYHSELVSGLSTLEAFSFSLTRLQKSAKNL